MRFLPLIIGSSLLLVSACAGKGESETTYTAPDQGAPYAADPVGLNQFLGGPQPATAEGQRPVSDSDRPTNDSGQRLPGQNSEYTALQQPDTNDDFDGDDFDDDIQDDFGDDTPVGVPIGSVSRLGEAQCERLCAEATGAGCESCAELCTQLPSACEGVVSGIANCVAGRAGGGGQECAAAEESCLTDSVVSLLDCSGGNLTVESSSGASGAQ